MRNRLLWRAVVTLIVIGVAAGGLALAHRARHANPRPSSPTARHAVAPANIVFVLTDDLSMNLLRFMPHVQAMQRSGLTFENYFVSDSLCCPSRASILTGEFPHDTDVYSNVGPHGGFTVFRRQGDERRTFAIALQHAGYLTAMMGKYLNGYMDPPARAAGIPDRYVPPGWSAWNVAGWGYPEFDYTLNQNGILRFYGHGRSDYLTDVLARRGVSFIDRAAAARRPFFLELATFAPHKPYAPAPRDLNRFAGLTVPPSPNFDVMPTNPPDWLARRPPLTAAQIREVNRVFRRRAQSVLAVDAMIGRIETALSANGLARNTYLVFSSDNGYHTGEYRLMPGKLTAFDTDIRVPLVVVGPGVPTAARSYAMVQNIDLAETFAAIAGDTTMRGDGHSLLSLWNGQRPAGWRNTVLIEHQGPDVTSDRPDYQEPASGNPDTYEAMRTDSFLYVEYTDHTHEYYDLRTDPFELHNIAGSLSRTRRGQLHRELIALRRCHNSTACWRAMHTR